MHKNAGFRSTQKNTNPSKIRFSQNIDATGRQEQPVPPITTGTKDSTKTIISLKKAFMVF
jgi:hypothetical protein